MVYLLEELALLAVAWRQQNLRANLGSHITTTSSSALALAPARAVALAMEQKAGTAIEQWIRFGPSLVVSLPMARALLERQHRTDVAIKQVRLLLMMTTTTTRTRTMMNYEFPPLLSYLNIRPYIALTLTLLPTPLPTIF